MYGQNNAQQAATRAARNKNLSSTKARPEILTLLAPLDVNDNGYTLSLKHESQQKIAKLTKGLLDRDGFIATHMKVGVLPVKVVAGTLYFTAQHPLLWADPLVFDIAAGTAVLSEAEAIESIPHGHFSINTNEEKRLEKYSLQDFRIVQQTQHSANTQNMQTGLEWVPLDAAYRFAGGDENELHFQFDCLDKTHWAGNADRKNFLWVGLKGSIIKGITTKAFLSGSF